MSLLVEKTTLPELEARLQSLQAARYGIAETAAEAEVLAEKVGDSEYLMARIRCLEATLAQHAAEVAWTSPADRSSPAQALLRIRALCAQFPDLFQLMFVMAATQQSVPRERLALAVKQFRRDTDALSKEDVMGLLSSVTTGGYQAFEAVLRTRKGGGKAAASSLPWGKNDD